jgi:hypothetical protein
MNNHQNETDGPLRSAQAGMRHPVRSAIRIQLSGGSSLSARQTITALGKSGYTLDICDPNPLCISRFTRFVRRSYRCPTVGTDPLGYLAFVLRHLTREPYDVLLPVHEQAFLLAKVRDRIHAGVAVALAPFDAFLQVQGKVAFARLMERLSLPKPATHIVSSRAEMETLDKFPCYLKTDYSTAGQGVWRITNKVERDRVSLALEQRGQLGGTRELVVQEEATGNPTYIVCNPRLVEPMNGTLSGVNLADLTVRVALGEMGASGDTLYGRPGRRSHSLMAILLGIADHGGSRGELLRTIEEDIRGRGNFARSREDLTPVRLDPPCLIPLVVVTGQLLLHPRAAQHLAAGTVNAYSLTAAVVETIMAFDGK